MATIREFFKWAKSLDMSDQHIANVTGYTRSYITQVRLGHVPVTQNFIARMYMHFPGARRILKDISVESDD